MTLRQLVRGIFVSDDVLNPSYSHRNFASAIWGRITTHAPGQMEPILLDLLRLIVQESLIHGTWVGVSLTLLKRRVEEAQSAHGLIDAVTSQNEAEQEYYDLHLQRYQIWCLFTLGLYLVYDYLGRLCGLPQRAPFPPCIRQVPSFTPPGGPLVIEGPEGVDLACAALAQRMLVKVIGVRWQHGGTGQVVFITSAGATLLRDVVVRTT